ncbi:MAG: hypothetical protein ISR69_06835 [Gammaproteobacteria bacterium]|nr:hypothetical protein [Gammaproteobacteria bacterium]
MSIISKTNKSEKNLWVWTLLLSLVLLFGQNSKLHVHSLDHADNQQINHKYVDAANDHSGLGEAHLSTDSSHSDHHAEIVSEIDTSLNALLIDTSVKIPVLALLITLLVFYIPSFYHLVVHRRSIYPVYSFCRNHFSPPLRAPPL